MRSPGLHIAVMPSTNREIALRWKIEYHFPHVEGPSMPKQRRQYSSEYKSKLAVAGAAALLSLAGSALYMLRLVVNRTPFDFPIDDAWIHLTYARNLAQRFEFSFLPGVPSAACRPR
jgi:hypothetical protein